jgi:hypothetical protein
MHSSARQDSIFETSWDDPKVYASLLKKTEGDGKPIIRAAARRGPLSLIDKVLNDSGLTNVSEDAKNLLRAEALILCIRYGHIDYVRALAPTCPPEVFEIGDKVNENAIYAAAASKQADMVEAIAPYCLEKAFQGKFRTWEQNAFLEAAESGSVDIVKTLWPYYSASILEERDLLGRNALMVAANTGEAEVVSLIASLCPDSAFDVVGTQDYNNALMIAAQRGHAEVIKVLAPYYAKNGRINAQNHFGRTDPDHIGITAPMIAARNRSDYENIEIKYEKTFLEIMKIPGIDLSLAYDGRTLEDMERYGGSKKRLAAIKNYNIDPSIKMKELALSVKQTVGTTIPAAEKREEILPVNEKREPVNRVKEMIARKASGIRAVLGLQ